MVGILSSKLTRKSECTLLIFSLTQVALQLFRVTLRMLYRELCVTS